MSIIRRAFCVAAFAFSLCAWADADYFVYFSDDLGYHYSYTYNPSSISPSVLGFPSGTSYDPYSDSFFDSSGNSIGFLCWDDPFSDDWEMIPSDYVPSNPAYADMPIAPASDPLSGGGGSSSGGGDGEGGFDPVGFFGGLPSMMSGLASVAVGLFAIASGILLTFLVFRKVRYSSKRI